MIAQLQWFESNNQAVVVTKDKVCKYQINNLDELEVAIKVLESVFGATAKLTRSKKSDVFVFKFN